MERAGATTMKGAPLTLVGPELKVGDKAPDFSLMDRGLKAFTLKDPGSRVRIISVIPSLDTPVCDAHPVAGIFQGDGLQSPIHQAEIRSCIAHLEFGSHQRHGGALHRSEGAR